MKYLIYILPFLAFGQSDGIASDNAIVTLGDLQQDISFGHDCNDLQNMTVYVNGDIELNDKILAIRKCKIIVNGFVKINGVIVLDLYNNDQIIFECETNSIIELIE